MGMFDKITGIWSQDMAIDLGTANTLVVLKEKGKTTVGQAADTDTLVASANAYINALNKMIIKRDKTAPMEQESQKVRGI